MIKGVGVDLVSISRIERILLRTPALDAKIPNSQPGVRTPHELARDIAVFEALFKALPSNYKNRIRDFRINKDASGKPIVNYIGEMKSSINNLEILVSISHEGDYVIAIVLIEFQD
jgi:holo-[acyl-carrier protein] synthase